MAQTSGPGWPALEPGGSGAWGGPEEPPEPKPWHERRTLWLVVAVVTAVGYVAVGITATVRVYGEFHRKPTPWELYRASSQEVRDRWRTWPAEKIFPDSVPYTSEQGGAEHAQRVGIAPETACTSGIDPAPGAVLLRNGCRALLRATYVDQLQGVVFTVGIAALIEPRAATAVQRELLPGDPTEPGAFLHALAFPRTVTARFDDHARQYVSVGVSGPYVVFTVAGQTDGRPAGAVKKKHTGAFLLAPEAGDNIADVLARPAQPDCSQTRQWKC
jgi:hypothetical protein